MARAEVLLDGTARPGIRRLGCKKLGEPDARALSLLTAVGDLDHLIL
jgi:hypothetical protein